MAVSELMRLQQERADLAREQAELFARDKQGGTTAVEARRFAEIGDRLIVLNPLIERMEREREELRAIANAEANGQVAGRRASGPRWKEMWGAQANDTGGYRDFKTMMQEMHHGLSSPQYLSLLSGSGNDQGATGLLIPSEFSGRLMDASLEDEIVRRYAQIEPMRSDSKVIAGFYSDDNTSNPFGSGGWTGQAQEIVEGNPSARSVTLTAHKLAALVQVSNEAIEDGQSVDEQLSIVLPKALGWLLDSAFFSGSGAGEPLGVLNANATIAVALEGGQVAADGPIYENVTKMLARLAPGSFNTAIWVANPTCIPALMSLSIGVGAAGQVVPILSQNGTTFSLLTRPLLFSEKLPAVGSRGCVGLFDFQRFVVGMRAEVRLEKSAHLGFSRDTTYYRCLLRADGSPLVHQPQTMANGGTVSPFVILDSV